MARSSEPRSELVRSQTARLDGGRCLCECVVWECGAVGERGDRCACARCVRTAPALNRGHAESSFTILKRRTVRHFFTPGGLQEDVTETQSRAKSLAWRLSELAARVRPWIAGAGQSCLRPSRPSLRCCSWLCMTRSRDAGGSPKAERSAGPPPTPCEKQRPVAEAALRLPRRLRRSRPSEQTLLP